MFLNRGEAKSNSCHGQPSLLNNSAKIIPCKFLFAKEKLVSRFSHIREFGNIYVHSKFAFIANKADFGKQ